MPAKRIGDETVKAKTGKNWHEWFDIIQKAGTKTPGHQQIVALLTQQHGLSDWWSQMITNAFEQHTRKRQQRGGPEGYEISVSRTFPVDVKTLYETWSADETRRRWLQQSPLNVTTSTRNRSIRARWEDDDSRLIIDFSSKTEKKSQVVVQHVKLPSLKSAEDMQIFWKEKLAKLDELLKQNKPDTPDQT